MKFREYIDKEINIIENLIDKFNNIKKYNTTGQSFLFVFLMIPSIIFCNFINYLENNMHSYPKIFILSILISFVLLTLFNVIFESSSRIFKNNNIECKLGDFWGYKFYNKKEKKEIINLYNSLDCKTKEAFDSTINSTNKPLKEDFLYTLILNFTNNNVIFQEYKDIIEYINENYHGDYKSFLITNVIDKIKKESENRFLDNKDEISEYIYNSNLSNQLKKDVLSKIKILTEEDLKEDVKNLYKDINKLNKATKLVQQL